MSKWFTSAQDLSDSESSDSSDEEKKVSTQQTSQAAKKTTGATATQAKSKFKNFEDSSESEDEQRIVKTGSDKKKEALNQLMADLKNHIKINDFGQIMTDFERLTEEIDKAANGGDTAIALLPGDVLPNYVIRALIKIEDCINDTQDAIKAKKMNLSK